MQRDGAIERSRLLLNSKNDWMDRYAAANADAERLFTHLVHAIHDLIEDWEPDGPQMNYEQAAADMHQHEERMR